MTDEEAVMVAVKAGGELALTERAFDGLKVALVNRLTDTDFPALEERERIYVALKTLGMVRAALEASVAAGKNAKVILDHQVELAAAGVTGAPV